MRFNSWYPYYLIIAKYLDLRFEKDFLCTLLLSNQLKNSTLNLSCFTKLINSKTLVIGAGPSIEEPAVQKYIVEKFRTSEGHSKKNKTFVIAADGAAEFCLTLDIIPDFIVSDLDGDLKSLYSAEKEGAIILVHGHGDNIQKIKSQSSDLRRIIGTTQTFPLYNVHNFGGFTDGDRGVFLADHFDAKEIFLVGMDFDSKIGYYSKKHILDMHLKKQKLSVAKYLLEIICKTTSSQLVHIASSKYGTSIRGVNKNKLI